jgi:hypothetical protein
VREKEDLGETRMGVMLPQRLPLSLWPGDLDEPRTMFAGLVGELRDKRLAREKRGLGEEPVEPDVREKGDLGETCMGVMLPQRLPPSPWPVDLDEPRTMFAGLVGELRDKRLAREKGGLGEEPVELDEGEFVLLEQVWIESRRVFVCETQGLWQALFVLGGLGFRG